MKQIFFSLALLCSSILLSSCLHEEGIGGSSSIEGYVFKVLHNDDDFSLSADTIPAVKTDVYITYGSDEYFGDDIETGSDGFYRFDYLTKGSYTIHSYSTLASGEKIKESKSVKISRGESKKIANIYIHEGKAYGTSMIKGVLLVKYFYNGSLLQNGDGTVRLEPLGDERVYLRKKGEEFYIDDVRTSSDGVFVFQKVLPGEYEVYAYTIHPDDLAYEKIYVIRNESLREVNVTKRDSIFETNSAIQIVRVL